MIGIVAFHKISHICIPNNILNIIVNKWNVIFCKVYDIYLFTNNCGGLTTPEAPSPITVEPYSRGKDFPRPIDDTEHLNSEISFVYAG